MVQINQLTATSPATDGMNIPVFSPQNGDARRISVSDLRTYMQTNLDFFESTDVVVEDIAALRLITGAIYGQTYLTLSYSKDFAGGGAQYRVVADGTHTNGVGGASEGGSYLQGQSVQYELVAENGVSVQQFGAVGTGDNSVAVQAAIDYARTTYNMATGDFDVKLDFGGRNIRVDTSINLTLLRQPGFTLKNGGLDGHCTGKIVLDAGGTNTLILDNFFVYGDKTNKPSVGLYQGRAEINGGYPASAGHKYMNLQVSGYFSKSSLINFASEVSQQDNVRLINKDRSANAYSYISCGHAGTLDDYVGGLTSDYATIPTAATGAHSNILHHLDQAHIQRPSDVVIQSITSITNANPIEVTVNPSDLTNAELTNGDEIVFTNVGGMTELNHNAYKITSIDLVAGTFSLLDLNSTPIDSTSYGAWTSGGNIWNRTGPAILLNGSHSVNMQSSYLLTYGREPIVVDLNNGSTIRDCELNFHAEASPPTVVRLDRDTSTATIQRLNVELLNTSQEIRDEFMRLEGTGAARIDGLRMSIANLGTSPANTLFNPASGFTLRDADIYTPLEASMPALSAFTAFSGRVYSADTDVRQSKGDDFIELKRLDLVENFTALTDLGLRFANNSFFWRNDTVGAERRIRVQDSATSGDFTNAASRVNNEDKYAGKEAWDASALKPVYAQGGATTSVWVDATGATAYTPA